MYEINIIAVVMFFIGLFVIGGFTIFYLDGRFSHRHEFKIVERYEIKRNSGLMIECDIPVKRLVCIQRCDCGKMKKEAIDIC